jgi:hypothetical protein
MAFPSWSLLCAWAPLRHFFPPYASHILAKHPPYISFDFEKTYLVNINFYFEYNTNM